jgi:hypothetical protein
MTEINWVEHTEEEIQQKINDIYEQFPMLRDYKPDDDCVHCQSVEVTYEFGYPAAEAWEELDAWKWLLGEDDEV